MRPCQSTARIKGLYVNTYSAVGGQPTCQMNGAASMVHHVSLESLDARNAEIICQGAIVSQPRFIRFDSRQAHVGDDDAHWHAAVTLKDKQHAVFDHVALLPVPAFTGGQVNIQLQVKVKWVRNGDPFQIPADCDVTVAIVVAR